MTKSGGQFALAFPSLQILGDSLVPLTPVIYTKLVIEMFHHESWKPFIVGSKGKWYKKHCWRGSWHSMSAGFFSELDR